MITTPAEMPDRQGASGSLYAVDPDAPDSIYVTDEKELHRSDDGGCNWSDLTPRLPEPRIGTSILWIAVPGGSSAPGHVFIAVQTDQGGPSSSIDARAWRLYRSDDHGQTWTTTDAGLPPTAIPDEIVFAPNDPSTAYLSIKIDSATGDYACAELIDRSQDCLQGNVLYRTADAGGSWELAGGAGEVRTGTPLEAVLSVGAIRDLVVDPVVPDQLWAATSQGIYGSQDGGEHWMRAVATTGATVVGVYREPGSPARVVALDPDTGTFFSSYDPSRRGWTSTSHPQLIGNGLYLTRASLAFGRDAEDMMVSLWTAGVFRSLPGDVWVDVSGGWDVLDVTSDRTARPSFFGRHAGLNNVIVRYQARKEFTGRLGLGDGVFDSTLSPAAAPSMIGGLPEVSATRAGDLAPSSASLTLSPGKSETVRYRLDLPPRPKPMDVYFLLDSTGSMAPTIDALKEGMGDIIAELRRAGIDVWAGVGDYRTYDWESDRRPKVANYPYRRIRAVGPIDEELVRAMQGIRAAGNSGSGLTALYQSATGSGQDVIPPGPSRADVAPGMGAGFRNGSVRVVVMAADRYFNTPDRPTGDDNPWPPGVPWPGPTFDQAIDALNKEDIHQVGIAIKPSFKDSPSPDLEIVARGTSTLAPPGGIDCDSDGFVEISEGQPLVCTFSDAPPESQTGGSDPVSEYGKGLVAGITKLLSAVEDRGLVELSELSDSGIVTEISPGTYQVDLRSSNELRFDVTYTCPTTPLPDSHHVQLGARARGTLVARAESLVTCDPMTALSSPPITTRPVIPLIGPIPPLPPPAAGAAVGPATAPAPAPAPQPAPAQAGQGQAQAAAVPQQQQQPQVALVRAAHQVREQIGLQNAMVSTSQRRDPLGAARTTLGLGSLATVMAYGAFSLNLARRRAEVTAGRRDE
jgi:photosystem II stability/assembly factor-like uncharacterized protein